MSCEGAVLSGQARSCGAGTRNRYRRKGQEHTKPRIKTHWLVKSGHETISSSFVGGGQAATRNGRNDSRPASLKSKYSWCTNAGNLWCGYMALLAYRYMPNTSDLHIHLRKQNMLPEGSN